MILNNLDIYGAALFGEQSEVNQFIGYELDLDRNFFENILMNYLKNHSVTEDSKDYHITSDTGLLPTEKIFCRSYFSMSSDDIKDHLKSLPGLSISVEEDLVLNFIILNDVSFEMKPVKRYIPRKFTHISTNICKDHNKYVQYDTFVISSDFDPSIVDDRMSLYIDIFDTIWTKIIKRGNKSVKAYFNPVLEKYVVSVSSTYSVDTCIFICNYLISMIDEMVRIFDLSVDDIKEGNVFSFETFYKHITLRDCLLETDVLEDYCYMMVCKSVYDSILSDVDEKNSDNKINQIDLISEKVENLYLNCIEYLNNYGSKNIKAKFIKYLSSKDEGNNETEDSE